MPFGRVILVASLACALALALVAIRSSAQTTPPDDQGKPGTEAKLCFKCRRTGKIPCTLHKPEDDALFCSVYLNKPCCLGLGFTLCPKCKVDAAIEEWDELKKKRDAWLEARQKTDKETGETLVHLENAHFRFDMGLHEVSAKDQHLDMHKGAHLYLGRLEALWNLYSKVLDTTKESVTPKHDVYLFEKLDSFTRYMKKYVGEGGGGIAGHKTLGDQVSRFVTWRNPDLTPSDEDVHANLIHNSAHLLLHKYKGYKVHPPAWLDEGFAYYCEWTLCKATRTFCFVEVPPDSNWKNNEWKTHVYKSIGKKGNPSFGELSTKELNGMDYEDMAFSFTYVDFLIAKDKDLFRKFVDEIKAGKKTADALRDVYGWLPAEFDENWQKYVLRAYATK